MLVVGLISEWWLRHPIRSVIGQLWLRPDANQSAPLISNSCSCLDRSSEVGSGSSDLSFIEASQHWWVQRLLLNAAYQADGSPCLTKVAGFFCNKRVQDTPVRWSSLTDGQVLCGTPFIISKFWSVSGSDKSTSVAELDTVDRFHDSWESASFSRWLNISTAAFSLWGKWCVEHFKANLKGPPPPSCPCSLSRFLTYRVWMTRYAFELEPSLLLWWQRLPCA